MGTRQRRLVMNACSPMRSEGFAKITCFTETTWANTYLNSADCAGSAPSAVLDRARGSSQTLSPSDGVRSCTYVQEEVGHTHFAVYFPLPLGVRSDASTSVTDATQAHDAAVCDEEELTDSPLGMVSNPPLEFALAAWTLRRPLSEVGGWD